MISLIEALKDEFEGKSITFSIPQNECFEEGYFSPLCKQECHQNPQSLILVPRKITTGFISPQGRF